MVRRKSIAWRLLWLLLAICASPRLVASTATDRLEAGRKIYNFHCYFCHGYAGDARTLAASYLTPPPRNFRATRPDQLTREVMIDAVSTGRSGTAMQGFAKRLSREEIGAVVDFIRAEFIEGQRDNTVYHTAANGWYGHDRYAIAYPFATGKIPLDTPWTKLTVTQARGKRLFLTSCVSCHDRARVTRPGPIWESRPLSYPRAGYSHRPGEKVDAISGVSPYAVHDIPPPLPADTDPEISLGATVFQQNCAFCHGGDGTGKNWIGRFMEPHPRDLTDPAFADRITRDQLRKAILDGLPGTSMPAWKHVLGDEEVTALISYIEQVLQPPARNP